MDPHELKFCIKLKLKKKMYNLIRTKSIYYKLLLMVNLAMQW